ncbi:hypothetical protein PS15p_202593 [Mucor circinelloides]
MAIAKNGMSKRDAPSREANLSDKQVESSSSSTTSKKPLTYTLPTMYTPMPTTTVTEDATSTEDPGQYHLTLFTPLETSSSIADTVEITQKRVDPYVSLPTEYSVLVSKAPNEVTRTTKSWAIATSTASANASATTSVIPVKSYSGLNKGQLAGVIVGSIAGGLIAIYLFYVICWGRRKALRKAREEKELQDMEKKATRASTIHLDYDSDEDEEKSYMHHDDNQPVSLPRSQLQYDPTRIYSSTSRSDPKEDFRSYYRTRPNSISNSSSLSGGSNTPLNVHSNSQPFYGGFSPFYGPMLQPQSPAFVNNSTNNNMPLYGVHQQLYMSMPPTTMPVSGNASQYFSQVPFTAEATSHHHFNHATTGIHPPQHVYHSNANSIASGSDSERCASTISSVLMHDEDIESLPPPDDSAAVLDSVDYDDTTKQELSPSSHSAENNTKDKDEEIAP